MKTKRIHFNEIIGIDQYGAVVILETIFWYENDSGACGEIAYALSQEEVDKRQAIENIIDEIGDFGDETEEIARNTLEEALDSGRLFPGHCRFDAPEDFQRKYFPNAVGFDINSCGRIFTRNDQEDYYPWKHLLRPDLWFLIQHVESGKPLLPLTSRMLPPYGIKSFISEERMLVAKLKRKSTNCFQEKNAIDQIVADFDNRSKDNNVKRARITAIDQSLTDLETNKTSQQKCLLPSSASTFIENNFDKLPAELIEAIFDKLPTEARYALALTCRRMFEIANKIAFQPTVASQIWSPELFSSILHFLNLDGKIFQSNAVYRVREVTTHPSVLNKLAEPLFSKSKVVNITTSLFYIMLYTEPKCKDAKIYDCVVIERTNFKCWFRLKRDFLLPTIKNFARDFDQDFFFIMSDFIQFIEIMQERI